METLDELLSSFGISQETYNQYSNQQKSEIFKIEKKVVQYKRRLQQELDRRWLINAMQKGLSKAEEHVEKALMSLEKDVNTYSIFSEKLEWIQKQKVQADRITPFILSDDEILELWLKIVKCRQEQELYKQL